MKTLLLTSLALMSYIGLSQNILYVDALATGNNTGTSWTNAYPDLQLALEAAQAGDEIWVAKATYFPSKDTGNVVSSDPRERYFTLVEGVGIYGGFDGTETQRSQRDWTSNFTVLSGEQGVPNDKSDNSYHVVCSIDQNLSDQTILDGFVIEKGNADSYLHKRYGGGIHISGPGEAVFRNLILLNNSASSGGAIGMVDFNNFPADPRANTFINCRILNNYAVERGGGAFQYRKRANYINCLFFNNIASNTLGALPGLGAGLFSVSGYFWVYNCTFSFNSAKTSGDGIYSYNNLGFEIYNSIIDNSMDIEYSNSSDAIDHKFQNSLVKSSGGSSSWSFFSTNDLGGNIDTVPKFYAYDKLKIKHNSPAKDAGLISLLPDDTWDFDGDGNTNEPIPLDLQEVDRVYNGQVDMGAFEYTPAKVDSISESICLGDQFGFHGQLLDSAGVYSHIVKQNFQGDTVEYLTLHIDSVNTEVYHNQPQASFTAVEDSATYQWFSCDNDSLLPGDTIRFFFPKANGSYAVIVTNSNGCTDTSACYSITDVSLPEERQKQIVNLYPNPADDHLTLELNGKNEIQKITITGISGKVLSAISPVQHWEKRIMFDVGELPAGNYFLKVETVSGISRVPFIIK